MNAFLDTVIVHLDCPKAILQHDVVAPEEHVNHYHFILMSAFLHAWCVPAAWWSRS